MPQEPPRRFSRFSLTCVGLYGMAVIGTLLWAEQAGDPLSLPGLIFVLLLMPWTMLFSVMFDQIGPGMVDQFPWRWIAFFISASLNGLLIYFLTGMRLKSGKSFRLGK